MPLNIKVQGEGTVNHIADMVEIDIAFKSTSFYRNEASIALFKAVEQLTDTLKKLSPTLESRASMFQASPGGSIISWSIGAQHAQSQTTQVSQTKTHQTTHTATTSLKIAIHDFQILEQISKAITRAPCITHVKTSWSLTGPSAIRLKAETVIAEEVVLKASQHTLLSTNIHFANGDAIPLTRRMPLPQHGCFVGDFSYDYDYSGNHSDSRWTSRDESGNLDAWTLVLAPKMIALTAQVDAKFSATSSTGWVYEELDQHRLITR